MGRQRKPIKPTPTDYIINSVKQNNNPLGGIDTADSIKQTTTPPIDILQTYNRNAPTIASSNALDVGEYSGYGGVYDAISLDREQADRTRAEGQSGLAQTRNAIGRVVTNILPEIIKQAANMLDPEEYLQNDREVGNSIAEAMTSLQESANESMPIYRTNPNESFDFGDSGYWLENGANLATSAGAFAALGWATGGGSLATLTRGAKVLKGLNMARKGTGTLANIFSEGTNLIRLSNSTQKVVRGASTLSSAILLNQAEGVGVAVDVYNEQYNKKLEELKSNGLNFNKSDEELEYEAKTHASEAASSAIAYNRLNIALNLTSANMLMKPSMVTSKILTKPGVMNTFKNIGLEAGQEALEEEVNHLSQKLVTDKQGKVRGFFDMAKATLSSEGANEMFSEQGLESAMLGAIGGAGQTAITAGIGNLNIRANDTYNNSYKNETVKLQNENILNAINGKPQISEAEIETKAKAKALQEAGTDKEKVSDFFIKKQQYILQQEQIQKEKNRFEGNPSDANFLLQSGKEQEELQKKIEEAINNGDNEKADSLKDALIEKQAYTAFQMGTTQNLVDLYSGISTLSPNEAKAKGLTDDYKEKAIQAINDIKELEDIYTDSQANYHNSEDVYDSKNFLRDLSKAEKRLTSRLVELNTPINQSLDNKINEKAKVVQERELIEKFKKEKEDYLKDSNATDNKEAKDWLKGRAEERQKRIDEIDEKRIERQEKEIEESIKAKQEIEDIINGKKIESVDKKDTDGKLLKINSFLSPETIALLKKEVNGEQLLKVIQQLQNKDGEGIRDFKDKTEEVLGIITSFEHQTKLYKSYKKAKEKRDKEDKEQKAKDKEARRKERIANSWLNKFNRNKQNDIEDNTENDKESKDKPKTDTSLLGSTVIPVNTSIPVNTNVESILNFFNNKSNNPIIYFDSNTIIFNNEHYTNFRNNNNAEPFKINQNETIFSFFKRLKANKEYSLLENNKVLPLLAEGKTSIFKDSLQQILIDLIKDVSNTYPLLSNEEVVNNLIKELKDYIDIIGKDYNISSNVILTDSKTGVSTTVDLILTNKTTGKVKLLNFSSTYNKEGKLKSENEKLEVNNLKLATVLLKNQGIEVEQATIKPIKLTVKEDSIIPTDNNNINFDNIELVDNSIDVKTDDKSIDVKVNKILTKDLIISLTNPFQLDSEEASSEENEDENSIRLEAISSQVDNLLILQRNPNETIETYVRRVKQSIYNTHQEKIEELENDLKEQLEEAEDENILTKIQIITNLNYPTFLTKEVADLKIKYLSDFIDNIDNYAETDEDKEALIKIIEDEIINIEEEIINILKGLNTLENNPKFIFYEEVRDYLKKITDILEDNGNLDKVDKIELLKNNFDNLKGLVEEKLGISITPEDLVTFIKQYNKYELRPEFLLKEVYNEILVDIFNNIFNLSEDNKILDMNEIFLTQEELDSNKKIIDDEIKEILNDFSPLIEDFSFDKFLEIHKAHIKFLNGNLSKGEVFVDDEIMSMGKLVNSMSSSLAYLSKEYTLEMEEINGIKRKVYKEKNNNLNPEIDTRVIDIKSGDKVEFEVLPFISYVREKFIKEEKYTVKEELIQEGIEYRKITTITNQKTGISEITEEMVDFLSNAPIQIKINGEPYKGLFIRTLASIGVSTVKSIEEVEQEKELLLKLRENILTNNLTETKITIIGEGHLIDNVEGAKKINEAFPEDEVKIGYINKKGEPVEIINGEEIPIVLDNINYLNKIQEAGIEVRGRNILLIPNENGISYTFSFSKSDIISNEIKTSINKVVEIYLNKLAKNPLSKEQEEIWKRVLKSSKDLDNDTSKDLDKLFNYINSFVNIIFDNKGLNLEKELFKDDLQDKKLEKYINKPLIIKTSTGINFGIGGSTYASGFIPINNIKGISNNQINEILEKLDKVLEQSNFNYRLFTAKSNETFIVNENNNIEERKYDEIVKNNQSTPFTSIEVNGKKVYKVQKTLYIDTKEESENQKNNKEFNPIINTIENEIRQSISEEVILNPFNKDEYVIFDKNGNIVKKFDRVSSLKEKRGKTIFKDEKAAHRGNIVDNLLRVFIEQDNMSLEELKEIYKNTDKQTSLSFSDITLNSLFLNFKEIKSHFNLKGIKLISNIPTLYGNINGKDIAGTVDLLGIKPNGEIFIIDLKTSSQNRTDKKNKFYEDYLSDDTIQQSGYAELFGQVTGKKIKSIFIVPIQMFKSDETTYGYTSLSAGEDIVYELKKDKNIWKDRKETSNTQTTSTTQSKVNININKYGNDVINNKPLSTSISIEDYNDNFGNSSNIDLESIEDYIPEPYFNNQEEYDTYLEDFNKRRLEYIENLKKEQITEPITQEDKYKSKDLEPLNTSLSAYTSELNIDPILFEEFMQKNMNTIIEQLKDKELIEEICK